MYIYIYIYIYIYHNSMRHFFKTVIFRILQIFGLFKPVEDSQDLRYSFPFGKTFPF